MTSPMGAKATDRVTQESLKVRTSRHQQDDRTRRNSEYLPSAAEIADKRQSALSSPSESSQLPYGAPSSLLDVARSSGHPLDASLRAPMERQFGHNFSRVRVHTDSKAAESARVINAAAYTIGEDIVFGANERIPRSFGSSGTQLLAHELAHVVQQSRASKREILPSTDFYERGANRASLSVAKTASIHVSERSPHLMLQRQDGKKASLQREKSMDDVMKGRGARLVAGNEDEVRDILGLVGKVFDRIYELGQSWFLGESKGGTEKGVRDALVQLGVGADRLDNILKNPKERVEMAARILKKGRQATVPKPGKIRAVVNVKPDADIGRWKIFYPEHGYLYEKPKEGKGPSRVKIAGVGPTLDKSKIDYPYSEGQYPVEVIGGRKPPRESGAVSKATKKAPASETSQPAPRPPATKTTPSSTGSLPADSIPQWELVGEPARAGMRANVEGLALAINQELASYLQGEEVERALDAVEAIKPEINRRRKRGRWVALSVIVSAPVSVDLGKEIATDLKQIVFFSNVMLTDGATLSEAKNPPARLDVAPPTKSVGVSPPDPGSGRIFRTKILGTYPPCERETPTPLVSRNIQLQNVPLAEKYEDMILALRGAPDPALLEHSLLTYFAPYNMDNESVRDDIQELIAATPPTREELMAIVRALGEWVL